MQTAEPSASSTALLKQALTNLRGHVWPLVKIGVASRLVVAALYTPIAVFCLHMAIWLQGESVVTDTEIAALATSPLGLLGIIASGVALLAGLAAELLAMVFALRQPRASTFTTIRQTLTRLPTTTRVITKVLRDAALWTIPCLLVFGMTYLALLSDYDINYYLAIRPPEFYLAGAVLIAGLAFLAWRLILIAVDWLAAPAAIADGADSTECQQISRQVAEARTGSIRNALAFWLLISIVVPLLVAALGAAALAIATPWWPRSVTAVATGVGLWLLVNWLGGLAASLFGNALLASLSDTVLEREAFESHTSHNTEHADPTPVRGWFTVAAVVVVIAVSALVGHNAIERVAAPAEVQVIAHRGASAVAPENTIAAIEAAIDAGADWVEIDVQENAEGEVVVFHDSDFMKAGGVATKVWEISSDALAQIDVGSTFSAEFAGERVPTLREVLITCRNRIGVLIELKYYGHDVALEQRVVDLVEESGMVGQTRFMSLKRAGIEKLRSLRPEWESGLLLSVYLGDSRQLGADFLAMNAAFISARTVRSAAANDADVYAWTVNEPAKMGTLAGIGVAGLITDDPTLARASLEEWRTLSPIGRLLVSAAGTLTLTETIEQ